MIYFVGLVFLAVTIVAVVAVVRHAIGAGVSPADVLHREQQTQAKDAAVDAKATTDKSKIPQESDDALLQEVNGHRPGGDG